MGRVLGFCLYCLDSHHRRIALANLRFAFGEEKTEHELRQIALSNFKQLGMMAQELVTLKGLTKERHRKICDSISVEGEEHLRAAKKKNKAVILLGAHFGNWEYAHHFYASRINRLNFIVRKLDNDLLEQERLKCNEEFNVNILYKTNGLRKAISNLKNGEDLVVFTDMKTGRKEGVPAQFFGKKTSTLTIVATLSKKYNIPVVPMFIVRDTNVAHHRIIFSPQLDIGQIEEKQAVESFAQLQNDIIENTIRANPDHWLWIHRKWKCYHPEIYKR